MLKASQLDNDVKKTLAVMFYANEVDMDSKIDVNSEVKKEEDIVDVRDYCRLVYDYYVTRHSFS